MLCLGVKQQSKYIAMKNIVTTIILMVGFIGTAQVDMSEYKYVVVPKRFNTFKQENQHKTSTLIKYLFTQKGFLTVYDDNLPEELYNNRCMALYVDLIDDSSMFTTKTVMVLNNCENEEILISQEGRSKKKEYEASYKEAISDAFYSIGGLDYTYKASSVSNEEPITVSFKNDVKTVNESASTNVNAPEVTQQVASTEEQSYQDKTPVPSEYKKGVEKNGETAKQIATEETQSFVDKKPIETNFEKGNASAQAASDSKMTIGEVLYAQEIVNGFQLVDSTPKIKLKMHKSSMPNVYVATSEDKDGVVYTSDGKWFFEYFENDKVVKEELNIKF